MEAAQYYSNHLEEVTNAIMSFDGTEAQSIVESVGYITQVKEKLEKMCNATYFAKLMSVLNKNKIFATVQKISSLLSGKLKKTNDDHIK